MAVSVCVTDQTEEKIMSKNNQILRKQQQYEKIAKNIADNIVEQIQDMSYRGRLSNVSPVLPSYSVNLPSSGYPASLRAFLMSPSFAPSTITANGRAKQRNQDFILIV